MSTAKLNELLSKCVELFITIKSKIDTKLDKTANAVSASKLATPFTLSLTGDAIASGSVAGNANVNLGVVLKDIGVTAGSYGAATAVPVITVDAKGRITAVTTANVPLATTTVAGLNKLSGDLTSAATDTALTSAGAKALSTAVANAQATADAKLDKLDVAVAARKLSSPRTLTANGDGSWSVSFDGSADATAPFTLSATGVNAGTYPKVTVDAKGRVTAGSALVADDIPIIAISKVDGLQAALDQKGSGSAYSGILPSDTLTGHLSGGGYTYRNLNPAQINAGNVTGGTLTVSATAAPFTFATIGANASIGFQGWVQRDGVASILQLMLQGAGGYAITWPNNMIWDGGSPPVLASGTKKTLLQFLSIDKGATIYGSVVLSEVA